MPIDRIGGDKPTINRSVGTSAHLTPIAGSLTVPATTDAGVAAAVAGAGLTTAALNAAYVGAVVMSGTGIDPTGVANSTTAMQAKLSSATAGQTVKGVPGSTYTISAPLVIGSGVTLDMTGCTIKLTNGSNCNMIRNAASVAPLRTVSSAAITAGSKTLTNGFANFTSADVGRWVRVSGAFKTGPWVPTTGPLVARIASVTNSTTVELDTAAQVTKASNATLDIYACDYGIRVIGGTWNRQTNGWHPNTNTSPDKTTTYFAFIDGLTCHGMWFHSDVGADAGGFNLYAAAITNFLFEDIHLDSPTTVFSTDGINVQGPASNGSISKVYGRCGDDFVALLGINPVGPLMQTVGHIKNIEVSELFPDGTIGGFKVSGGGGCIFQSITMRGLHGTCGTGTGNSAVMIGDYTYNTHDGVSESVYNDIVVENVDAITGTSTGLVTIAPTATPNGSITLRDLTWRTPSPAAGLGVVFVTSDTVLGSLEVDGLSIESAAYGVYVSGTIRSLVVDRLLMQAAGTGVQIEHSIDRVRLSRVVASDPAIAYTSLIAVGGGSITTLVLDDIYTKRASGDGSHVVLALGPIQRIIGNKITLTGAGGDFMFASTGATGTMVCQLSNVVLDGAANFVNIQNTCEFTFNGLHIASLIGATIALVHSAASVVVRGSGLVNPSPNWFYRGGTEPIRVNWAELKCDISLLTKVSGDLAYNTNGGLSCGVGAVLTNGTNWKNLYTGATY